MLPEQSGWIFLVWETSGRSWKVVPTWSTYFFPFLFSGFELQTVQEYSHIQALVCSCTSTSNSSSLLLVMCKLPPHTGQYREAFPEANFQSYLPWSLVFLLISIPIEVWALAIGLAWLLLALSVDDALLILGTRRAKTARQMLKLTVGSGENIGIPEAVQSEAHTTQNSKVV